MMYVDFRIVSTILLVRIGKGNGEEPFSCTITLNLLKRDIGASLVVQWLRICLLMQGTRVRALV